MFLPLEWYAEARRVPPLLRPRSGLRPGHLDGRLDDVGQVTAAADVQVRRASNARLRVLGTGAVAAFAVPRRANGQRELGAQLGWRVAHCGRLLDTGAGDSGFLEVEVHAGRCVPVDVSLVVAVGLARVQPHVEVVRRRAFTGRFGNSETGRVRERVLAARHEPELHALATAHSECVSAGGRQDDIVAAGEP